MFGASDLQTYQEQGYLVVSGLFSSMEVQHLHGTLFATTNVGSE